MFLRLLTLLLLIRQVPSLPKGCNLPPTVSGSYSNASTTPQTYPTGTIISYSCGQGYFLSSGSGKAQCYLDGSFYQWKGPTLQCSPRSCPTPEAIQNGKILGTLFVFGSSVTYVCDEGYNLSTNLNIRICLATASWSHKTPSCLPVDCGNLADPSNGYLTVPSTTYMSKALYYCNSGYQLIGTSSRRCESSGQWSNKIPICKDQSAGICPPPKDLPYGFVKITGTGIEDYVTYICDDGKTEEVATCEKDGKWSDAPPTCSAPITKSTSPATTVKPKATKTTLLATAVEPKATKSTKTATVTAPPMETTTPGSCVKLTSSLIVVICSLVPILIYRLFSQ